MKHLIKIVLLVAFVQLISSCSNDNAKITKLDQPQLYWGERTFFTNVSLDKASTVLTKKENLILFTKGKNTITFFDTYRFVDGAKFSTTYKGHPFNYVIERWAGAFVPDRSGQLQPFYLIGLGKNLLKFETQLGTFGHLAISIAPNYIRDAILHDSSIKEKIKDARGMVGEHFHKYEK